MKKIIRIILRSQKSEDRNQRLLKSPFFLLLLFTACLATLHPLLFTVVHAAEFEVVDKLLVNGRSIFKSSITVYGVDALPHLLGLADQSGNYKVIVTTSGNVGIGTTAPSLNLHVEGSGQAWIKLLTTGTPFGWASGLNLGVPNDLASGQSFNWNVNYRTDSAFGGGARSLVFYENISDGTGGVLGYRVPLLLKEDGDVILAGASGVLSNGNVGIGTTQPSERLHVAGNVLVSTAATSPILYVSTTTGSVGIGTTDTEEKLVVNGTMRAMSGILFDNGWSGQALPEIHSNGVNLYLGAVGGGGDIVFRPQGAGSDTNAVYIKSSGNVGIGTTDPAGTLHVRAPDTQVNAVVVSTGTAADQYLVTVSTAGSVTLKADGTNTGQLKVGYTGASPAGYYAVYAP